MRNVAVAAIVISMSALVVQSAAFDSLQGSRSTDIGTAGDGNALVGIDLPDGVPIGGGSGACTFGPDAVTVTKHDADDVDTTEDVIVTGKVDVDVATTGDVRIESGARVDGDVDAGGCVVVESGALAENDVQAGGDVTIESGGRTEGDVDAGGDVVLQSGARGDGDVYAGGSVTVRSGARVDGGVDAEDDVTVESGAWVGGDVDAGGTVTVEFAAWVGGDVSEGGSSTSSYPRLVTTTNNQAGSVTVTVSLLDPSDGELVVDGSPVGDSTTVSILSGGSRTIHVRPTAEAGPDIGFRVEASNTADGTMVTLERSVSTVRTGSSGGGGDDSDDD